MEQNTSKAGSNCHTLISQCLFTKNLRVSRLWLPATSEGKKHGRHWNDTVNGHMTSKKWGRYIVQDFRNPRVTVLQLFCWRFTNLKTWKPEAIFALTFPNLPNGNHVENYSRVCLFIDLGTPMKYCKFVQTTNVEKKQTKTSTAWSQGIVSIARKGVSFTNTAVSKTSSNTEHPKLPP